MQLTHPAETLTVDFYPVKYANGDVSTRIMLKIVDFGSGQQSTSYVTKKNMNDEIDSRIHGYGYKVTDFHTDAQMFNSGLGCCC
jgi:hypothetical protein